MVYCCLKEFVVVKKTIVVQVKFLEKFNEVVIISSIEVINEKLKCTNISETILQFLLG